MTDLEINSIAEGIYRYLEERTETPLDGIAVLGIALCILHRNAGNDISFPEFAKSFHNSLLATHRSASAEGPGSLQ